MFKDLFKSKYTKWAPLGQFNFSGNKQYVVFARKNTKNGLIQFKTIQCNPLGRSGCVNPILQPGLIDTKEAWEKLTE